MCTSSSKLPKYHFLSYVCLFNSFDAGVLKEDKNKMTCNALMQWQKWKGKPETTRKTSLPSKKYSWLFRGARPCFSQ